MGFYGNYYKIEVEENGGLIAENKGQSTKISLTEEVKKDLNLIIDNKNNIQDLVDRIALLETQGREYVGNIAGSQKVFGKMCTEGKRPDNNTEKTIKVGDYVAITATFTLGTYGDYYLNAPIFGDTLKAVAGSILICYQILEEEVVINDKTYSAGYYFADSAQFEVAQKSFPIWNNIENNFLKFYDQNYIETEANPIENKSFIVDSEKQTISLREDNKNILLSTGTPLENSKGRNSIQLDNANNDINSENSIAIGSDLKDPNIEFKGFKIIGYYDYFNGTDNNGFTLYFTGSNLPVQEETFYETNIKAIYLNGVQIDNKYFQLEHFTHTTDDQNVIHEYHNIYLPFNSAEECFSNVLGEFNETLDNYIILNNDCEYGDNLKANFNSNIALFGKGNIATTSNQFIRGTYNKIDEEGKYIDIVGNGIDNKHRSNAYELDKEGNAYFAGDVYIQNKEGQDPVKLKSFEFEPQSNYVIVQNKGGQGVEVTDVGDYYITISTQFPDKVYCNDGITSNKIGWPYLEQFEVIGDVEVTNNQNGSLTINGTTSKNVEIIFHSWEYPNKYEQHKSYYQLMADNLPNGIVPYNCNSDGFENTNCRLVYNNENKKLIIQIDVNNLNGEVSFTNTILYPWVSKNNEDQDSIKTYGWQTPIGTQYNTAGQIKIKPTKQDALLFKTLNPINNLTISYYKNMNSILNIFPTTFNQDNQIALKRDCQKVYGYELDEAGQVKSDIPLSLQPYFKLSSGADNEDNYSLLEDISPWSNNNNYTKFMTNQDRFYNEKNGYACIDDNNIPVTYVFDQTNVYRLNHITRNIETIKSFEKINLTTDKIQIDSSSYIDGIIAVDKTYAYIVIHKKNIDTSQIEAIYLIKEVHTKRNNEESSFKKITENKALSLCYLDGIRVDDVRKHFTFNRNNMFSITQNSNFIILYSYVKTSGEADPYYKRYFIIDKLNFAFYKSNDLTTSEMFEKNQNLLLSDDTWIYNVYNNTTKQLDLSWYKIIRKDDTIQLTALMDDARNICFSKLSVSKPARIKFFVMGDQENKQIYTHIKDGTTYYVTVLTEENFKAPSEIIPDSSWDRRSFYIDDYIQISHYTNNVQIANIEGNKIYFSLLQNKFYYQNELLDFSAGEYIPTQSVSMASNYALIPYSYIDEERCHVVKTTGGNFINHIYNFKTSQKYYEVASWRGEQQWP